jgi:hypothetical protein
VRKSYRETGQRLCKKLQLIGRYAAASLTQNWFVYRQPRCGFPVGPFLRCIHTMGLQVDSQAVDFGLNREILKLAVVVRIVLLKHGNGPAVASDINPLYVGVELDDIRIACERQIGDRLMFVEIEYSHEAIAFAR